MQVFSTLHELISRPRHLCALCNSVEYTYLELPVVLGTIEELSLRTNCVICTYFSQLLAVELVLPTRYEHLEADVEPRMVTARSHGRSPSGSFFLVVNNVYRVWIEYSKVGDIIDSPSDPLPNSQTVEPHPTERRTLNKAMLNVKTLTPFELAWIAV